MTAKEDSGGEPKESSAFEVYLTLWVALCILEAVFLGKVSPRLAKYLDGLAIHAHLDLLKT